jgi:hypothetical protein
VTNILFDWSFEADVNRITQEDDRITLLYGSMNLERTIHLNVAEHPKDLAPTRAGHSIGRWEGDVLVVDTIGFEPGILSADARIPHSNQLHVTERFTLDADKGTIARSYIAEDPLYLQKPFTGADTVQVGRRAVSADRLRRPVLQDDEDGGRQRARGHRHTAVARLGRRVRGGCRRVIGADTPSTAAGRDLTSSVGRRTFLAL